MNYVLFFRARVRGHGDDIAALWSVALWSGDCDRDAYPAEDGGQLKETKGLFLKMRLAEPLRLSALAVGSAWALLLLSKGCLLVSEANESRGDFSSEEVLILADGQLLPVSFVDHGKVKVFGVG